MKAKTLTRLLVVLMLASTLLLDGASVRSDPMQSGSAIVFQASQLDEVAVAAVNCDDERRSGIPSSQCYALINFYNNAGGPGWKNQRNWLTDPMPCVWWGVNCECNPEAEPPYCQVKCLDLWDNNVTAIPPAVTALTYLQHLHLSHNGIGGAVPGYLGSLQNLTLLSLGDNNFTSVEPGVGGLSHLQFLDLVDNHLSSLPESLSGLKSLETLLLWGNSFTSMPSAIAGMSNLRQLLMEDNQLTGELPAWIGNLANLEELGLAINHITSVPPEIGKLDNLQLLLLQRNDITALPPEIGDLAKLEHLSLWENRLGAIPPEIGNLTNLKELDMSSNHVLAGTIPSSLGNLRSLEYLYLQENALQGQIPPSLGNLAELKCLNLGSNQLTGPIPTSLGQLANLEFLHLYDNQLTGSIPSTLGWLSKLKVLNLANNRLTGPLPAQLGYLPNLRKLIVSGNRGLYGPLPIGLLRSSEPRYISFYGTQICEPTDAEFQNLLWSDRMAGWTILSSGLACEAPPTLAPVGPAGGTLSSAADGTTYTFAPGTFGPSAEVAIASAGVVTVTHAPKAAGAAPSTGNLVGIRHFYDVYARDATGQYVQPVKPYTITIQYGPLDIAAGHAIESTLALYRWNGTSWVKEPTSRVNVISDTITANPSRFSTWAVLGEKAPARRRLPMVMKGE